MDYLLKPRIRFKGFTDAWEQRKLNEFTRYISSNLSISDSINNGKYNLYDANNIIGKVNCKNISEEFITIIKDGSGVGKVRRLPKNSCFIGTMGGILSKESNIDFVYCCLLNTDFTKEINGATIPHIYYSNYGNNEYYVPKYLEQEKIGELFTNIDNLITLHQRKCEKLINIKQSLLEKMFPKNLSNLPEIRFKGFTDVWEQRKFGDYGTVSMCKRIFKNETSDSGDIPFYKIGTFGGKADAFISNEKYDYYKSKFSYPNKGDILLSASGTIGRIVEYTGEKAYFQDSNIVWLNHNEDIKNVFLKVLYPTVKWDGIEGSTIKRLYNSNFLNTCINIPNTLEQEKIGELFTNIDNLITLHQRKHEKLINLKQSLLNDMFI